jgi:hypothetical protein
MGYDRNDCWMTCGEHEDRCAEMGLMDGPFPKDPFAEIERLRAALEKYGGHLEGCPFKGECTCGLKELIGRM